MNANEIRDRIRDTPRDIRVLCPRGHFIADVALDVPDGQDDIAMWPRGPHKRSVFNQLAGWYGFFMSLSRSNVRRQHDAPRWKCPNARCRYSSNVGYTWLATEQLTEAEGEALTDDIVELLEANPSLMERFVQKYDEDDES